jgi:hypothetical protein
VRLIAMLTSRAIDEGVRFGVDGIFETDSIPSYASRYVPFPNSLHLVAKANSIAVDTGVCCPALCARQADMS